MLVPRSAWLRVRWTTSALLGLIGLTVVTALPPAAAWSPESPPAAGVTVFLVRHAEAEASRSRDPDLSSAGRTRATRLATVLRDVGVTHLYASQFQRTRQTLAPLSEQCGQPVDTLDAGNADGLVRRLRALPDGSVAVVAGHSNTIPDLVRRLGGNPTGLVEHPRYGWILPHEEYSRLFVVSLRRPSAEAEAAFAGCLELRYGPE